LIDGSGKKTANILDLYVNIIYKPFYILWIHDMLLEKLFRQYVTVTGENNGIYT